MRSEEAHLLLFEDYDGVGIARRLLMSGGTLRVSALPRKLDHALSFALVGTPRRLYRAPAGTPAATPLKLFQAFHPRGLVGFLLGLGLVACAA